MKDDIVIKNATKPFSSIIKTRSNNDQILCSLCANVGIESVVRDNVCEICGDIGIKHGISTGEDDLFVVNSVGGDGGGAKDSNSTNTNYITPFGGLPDLEKNTSPPHKKTLQDALKETEIT